MKKKNETEIKPERRQKQTTCIEKTSKKKRKKTRDRKRAT